MQLYRWSTAAANNNASVPDGAPEGWLGANVNNWARETMAQVRAHASDAAYVDETYQLASVGTKSLTRNSTTQLVVQGCDATAHFTADRRIRIVGATTDHGFVTSSSYSAPDTTVNVVMDSGDVPASPTQVLVHVDTKIRGGAYYKTGSGNLLDADKLDSYHAADIFGPAIYAEAIVNGGFSVWQRGTSSVSCPAGSRTFRADRWFTNPSGAAVTAERTTTTPTGAISRYGLKVTGAASVTTCDIAGQRIESYLIPYIKTTVCISALVKNDTGGTLDLELLLGTPGSADDFTTVTNRATVSIASVTSGASERIFDVIDISGYTNIDNGLEIKFRAASGSLDSALKSVTITEVQIDRSTLFSRFRLRQIPDEMVRCKRYYRKTFAQSVAVAQNSGSLAGALHCQMNAQGTGSPRGGVQWQFAVPMRTTPTITTYNPTAAAATWDEVGGSNTLAATVLDEGDSGAFIYTATSSSGDVSRYAIHATAEAEL